MSRMSKRDVKLDQMFELKSGGRYYGSIDTSYDSSRQNTLSQVSYLPGNKKTLVSGLFFNSLNLSVIFSDTHFETQ